MIDYIKVRFSQKYVEFSGSYIAPLNVLICT